MDKEIDRLTTNPEPRKERGQVLILMVLVFTIIFLIGAIAIDVGLWLSERRGLQRAADFATLSGLIELPTNPALARTRALEWADRNGYKDGVDGVTIQVDMLCSNGRSGALAGMCYNADHDVPTPCVPEVDCDTMKVTIRKPGALRFMSIFGVNSMMIGSGAGANLAFDVIPMDSVLLLDDTQSMDEGCNGSQSNAGCPIRESKIAAHEFVDTLLVNPGALSKVGYAPYRGCYNASGSSSCIDDSGTNSRIRDLTQTASTLHTAINAANAAGGSGTNVCLPFTKAQGFFNGPNAQSGARRSIVILTDGDNSPSGSPTLPAACQLTRPSGCPSGGNSERYLDCRTRDIANVMKAAPYNAEIYVIGFGVATPISTQNQSCSLIGNGDNDNIADRRLLKCIASSTTGTNDHYFEVANSSLLPEIFNTIAWKIASRGLSQ